MGRSIPFDIKEKCDYCGVLGSFDFMGDFLCEKCIREEIEPEEYEDYKEVCPCGECKCGKKDESYHDWLS